MFSLLQVMAHSTPEGILDDVAMESSTFKNISLFAHVPYSKAEHACALVIGQMSRNKSKTCQGYISTLNTNVFLKGLNIQKSKPSLVLSTFS